MTSSTTYSVQVQTKGGVAHRSAELMGRYRDHPMDLADATLVALAEARDLRTVFTLDEHFRTYRLATRRHLHVVPS